MRLISGMPWIVAAYVTGYYDGRRAIVAEQKLSSK
jgi:hypothetical protein